MGIFKRYKLLFFIFFILIFGVIGYLCKGKEHFVDNVFSSSGSSVLTSQGDWQSGSYDLSSLDINTAIGSMQLGEESEIIFENSAITANSDITNKDKINDDNVSTYWESWIYNPGDEAWIKVDLGAVYNLSKIRIHSIAGAGVVDIQSSLNDSGYSSFDSASPGASWDDRIYSPAEEARYIRFYVHNVLGVPMEGTVAEVEFYHKPTSATHTTASTQIDGQEGSDDKTLIEWTSFTPTQTVPENTTLTYQFRTSDNASDWTEWTGDYTYSGTPIDLTGLSDDRYLQVKATLSNTDGASTPQIDDYTINFHNNQKPNQPTAQTAIIGN